MSNDKKDSPSGTRKSSKDNFTGKNNPNYKGRRSEKSGRRRARPGGLIKARIIQYKKGKKSGLLMLLEGPNKFKQIIFNHTVFDQNIEHYLYPNQVVSVRVDSANDNLVVSKVEFSPTYRKVKGEADVDSKKISGIDPSSVKPGKPKFDSKKLKLDVELEKTPQKQKSKGKKETNEINTANLSQNISDFTSSLNEVESPSKPKEIKKSVKKRTKSKAIVVEKQELAAEVPIKDIPDSSEDKYEAENESKSIEIEDILKKESIEISTNDLSSLTNALNDTSSEPTPIESDDLDSLTNRLTESNSEKGSNDLTDLDEINSLLGNLDGEEKTESILSSEFPEDANLDDLVSALAASGDLDADAMEQFQAMQNAMSKPEEVEEEVEDDSPYQSGFLDPNSKAFKRKTGSQESENSIDTSVPRRSLKEELKEEKVEKSFLETLVFTAEEDIEDDEEFVIKDPTEVEVEDEAVLEDDEYEYEYVYEDEDGNEVKKEDTEDNEVKKEEESEK